MMMEINWCCLRNKPKGYEVTFNTRTKRDYFLSVKNRFKCKFKNLYWLVSKSSRRSRGYGNGIHYRAYNRVSVSVGGECWWWNFEGKSRRVAVVVVVDAGRWDENKCYMATRPKLNFAHAYTNMRSWLLFEDFG